jgi:hypothetical protein
VEDGAEGAGVALCSVLGGAKDPKLKDGALEAALAVEVPTPNNGAAAAGAVISFFVSSVAGLDSPNFNEIAAGACAVNAGAAGVIVEVVVAEAADGAANPPKLNLAGSVFEASDVRDPNSGLDSAGFSASAGFSVAKENAGIASAAGFSASLNFSVATENTAVGAVVGAVAAPNNGALVDVSPADFASAAAGLLSSALARLPNNEAGLALGFSELDCDGKVNTGVPEGDAAAGLIPFPKENAGFEGDSFLSVVVMAAAEEEDVDKPPNKEAVAGLGSSFFSAVGISSDFFVFSAASLTGFASEMANKGFSDEGLAVSSVLADSVDDVEEGREKVTFFFAFTSSLASSPLILCSAF